MGHLDAGASSDHRPCRDLRCGVGKLQRRPLAGRRRRAVHSCACQASAVRFGPWARRRCPPPSVFRSCPWLGHAWTDNRNRLCGSDAAQHRGAGAAGGCDGLQCPMASASEGGRNRHLRSEDRGSRLGCIPRFLGQRSPRTLYLNACWRRRRPEHPQPREVGLSQQQQRERRQASGRPVGLGGTRTARTAEIGWHRLQRS